MTRKQRIVWIASLTLNVVCVGWALSWLWSTFEFVGGQSERSPDGKWRANARSKSTEYTFDVRPHTDSVFEEAPLRRVAITPTDHQGPLVFRQLPKIIEWSPDSERVTFSIPSLEVTLEIAERANPK